MEIRAYFLRVRLLKMSEGLSVPHSNKLAVLASEGQERGGGRRGVSFDFVWVEADFEVGGEKREALDFGEYHLYEVQKG